RSFAERGIDPPENARHALERAAQLAPFDKSLWFDVAMMQMYEGKVELAKSSLQPLANDPHGGGRAESLRSLIEWLDGQREGVPLDGAAVAIAMSARDADPAEDDSVTGGEE
ncbi:MAG: hypothetical protein WA936_00930, partial [Erythrobacter sp.]